MVGGRDVMGARPLYWGENQDFSALASNRKALWRIGIKKTNSFPTGSVATLGSEGFKFKIVRSIVYSQEKQVTRQVAARKLEKLLQWSVKQRLLGVKEVAVAFSGGLDSSIVALLAGNIGIEVLLIHVALEGEAETDFAKEAAEQLKLPLCIRLCTERDVKRSMREVIRIAEDYDPVKVSIGIPIYFVAEKAAGMNCELLLAGQGADELFGGYKRYADEYVSQGNECVQETIFHDIVHIGEANLERDCKICKHFDVELRLPFATPEITDFAIKLPLELKMERKKNTLRKLILRQVAWNLKLPTDIVDRPKRAIQYSTGVSKVVRKIVRQNRMTTTEYFGRIFKDIFREVESEKNH
jgi:asparagine synthase (glutamine-hydrolysing)